jgi:hypothetical protein
MLPAWEDLGLTGPTSAPLKPVLPTGRKLGCITQKGQKKCEDGIKLQLKFSADFSEKAKSGPNF